MQQVSKDIFYQLTADFEWQPFEEDATFLAAQGLTDSLRYYIDNVQKPQIGCVGIERKKMGFSLLRIKGEMLKKQATDEKTRFHFYKELVKEPYGIIELNLSTLYTAEAEVALRYAGFSKPQKQFSTNLSKLISTALPLNYNKDWRRNLQKAHSAELSFQVIESPTEAQIQDFHQKHSQLVKSKHFGEYLQFDFLKKLLSSQFFYLGLVTDKQDNAVAGVVFYAKNNDAKTMYQYTSAEGREASASYIIYEGLHQYLRENGISYLDLGRISPSQKSKQSVFSFKNGLQGETISYLGEWVVAKSRLKYNILQFYYRHILHLSLI